MNKAGPNITLVLISSLAAFSLVVGGAFILCRGWTSLQEAKGFDRKQHRAFRSLRIGMERSEAFKRMVHIPIWTNHQFTLGQYEGNEKEYAKTNGIVAEVFYTWVNGVDWYYCVGFDRYGRLVVKGQGGT